MATLRGTLDGQESRVWVPLAVLAVAVLYFIGFVDGGVHAAAIGSPTALDQVHEFFHHARHLGFMCH